MSVVTDDVLKRAQREVRELHLFGPTPVARKPGLLEHARRCPVLGMTERVDSSDAYPSGNIDHRLERLRGIPHPPGVLREDIARHRFVRPLESQTRASEQQAIRAPPDQ